MQRAVLTFAIVVLVLVLPLGPNRFFLASTIVAGQIGTTWWIERRRLELIDQLGAYCVGEHVLVLAAGLICPPCYVPAVMLGIASVGVTAPYLTKEWLRRITPITVVGTIVPPLVHDIDGALPIIAISTLLCAHVTFNRSGAVLLAAQAMERAQHDADHDPLTGLANRRVLIGRLDELDVDADVGLLVIDLDNFKDVNDNFGHAVGDDVLREVAHRLTGCDSSTLAVRTGGDEFAVVVPGNADETERIADIALATLTKPVTAGGVGVVVRASIGLAHTSSAAPHELLRFADLAMFEAKRGGDGPSWYSGRSIRRP